MIFRFKEGNIGADLYCMNAKDFDYSELANKKTLTILDPPYDKWAETINPQFSNSIIALCSPQSRHETEIVLGKPKTELVWYFKDGRWVSNNLPRITHNYIYVYGETGNAFVGERQETTPQKKGYGAIGKDGKEQLGKRIYTPKENKQLNSVMEFPRNMREFGAWGKPKDMFYRLIKWINPDIVVDPYMGSGTIGVATLSLEKKYIGIEIDESTFKKAVRTIEDSQRQVDMFKKNEKIRHKSLESQR